MTQLYRQTQRIPLLETIIGQ